MNESKVASLWLTQVMVLIRLNSNPTIVLRDPVYAAKVADDCKFLPLVEAVANVMKEDLAVLGCILVFNENADRDRCAATGAKYLASFAAGEFTTRALVSTQVEHIYVGEFIL